MTIPAEIVPEDPSAGTPEKVSLASETTRLEKAVRSTAKVQVSTRTELVRDHGSTSEDRDTIPLAKEEPRVGKRDVSHGRVRVRRYVVEEPVRAG